MPKTLLSIWTCSQWGEWEIDETSPCLTGSSMVGISLREGNELANPSDKPTLHLVLPDSSRSNDGNPQFKTMHIIHSCLSKSYHQSYQIWAWEWSACSEGEWYSSQVLYGCHLSLSTCLPHHFTRATGKVHCYSEGVRYRLFNFSSARCYSYKGWREEDGFPWFR